MSLEVVKVERGLSRMERRKKSSQLSRNTSEEDKAGASFGGGWRGQVALPRLTWPPKICLAPHLAPCPRPSFRGVKLMMSRGPNVAQGMVLSVRRGDEAFQLELL